LDNEKDTSKYRPKRNEFQKIEDRKLAIEMLRNGCTYTQIAKKITETRPYSLSYQQVQNDIAPMRVQAIAEMGEHVAVIIDKELQEVEKVIEKAWEAINVKRELLTTTESGDTEKGSYSKIKEQWINTAIPAAMLKIVLDAVARRSTLLGIDTHLKYLDTNAAIESLTAKGYAVSDPSAQQNEAN
jgi:hypothetical protein